MDNKKVLLVFDAGNTTIAAGAYDDQLLIGKEIILDSEARKPGFLLHSLSLFLNSLKGKGYIAEEAVISSVVKDLSELLSSAMVSLGVKPLVLNPLLPLGIDIHIDNKAEVGIDLLCDCLGAKTLFGQPCFIADLGTASKYILSNENGDFEGCAIGPGLAMSVKALFSGTDALPEVEIKLPASPLGKNTIDSINASLTYGKADEIRGMANRYEQLFKKPLKRVIAGGYGPCVSSLLPEFEYVPSLGLMGVKEAYWRMKQRYKR